MGSTDLFSSSYGPGVVGTFMALIVLLGFGGLYMLVGDSYLQQGPPIETVIAENEKDIAQLKKSIAASTDQLTRIDQIKKARFELQRLEVKTAELDQRIQGLISKKEQAASQVAAAERTFEQYREQYRESARLSLVDRVFEELRTGDGKVFQNAKVTSVDPVRMNFQHDDGIGKVNLGDLPADLKTYLQYSEDRAKEHLVAEHQTDAKLGDAVKIAQQEDLVIKLERQAAEKRATLEKAKSSLNRAKRAVPAHERTIRAKRMEIADERGKRGVSRVPEMREQLRQMESDLRKVQRAVPDLSRQISDLTREIGETETAIGEARAKLARLHAGEEE